MRKFMLLLALSALSAAVAADDGDGFIWLDANTKIRIKPIGSAGAGATKAPEQPKRDKTPEQPKK